MLRTLGIPSRMVLGYKGAEYNSVGQYYHVRQLHTHTWVEAFLRTDHLPTSVPLPADNRIAGVWLRLDPTPADDEAELADGATFWERLTDVRDYLQLLWNDYVLGLDSERQRQAIYDPLRYRVMALFSREAWSYFFRVLLQHGFSWRAGIVVLTIGGVLVIVYRLVSRLAAMLAELVRQRRLRRRLHRRGESTSISTWNVSLPGTESTAPPAKRNASSSGRSSATFPGRLPPC